MPIVGLRGSAAFERGQVLPPAPDAATLAGMIKSGFLVLMIALAPLQAKPAQYCSMMDATVDACCCEHDEDVAQTDCASVAAQACCETIVEWHVGDVHGTIIAAAAKASSFIHDPPPAAADIFSPPALRHAVLPDSAPRFHAFSASGADIYLRTLRLRL